MNKLKKICLFVMMLTLTSLANAEKFKLACDIAFHRCPSGNCLHWKTTLSIDTDSNSVESNNDMYKDTPQVFHQVSITSDDIRFENKTGSVSYTISRVTGDMKADMSNSGLNKSGNMTGTCSKATALF